MANIALADAQMRIVIHWLRVLSLDNSAHGPLISAVACVGKPKIGGRTLPYTLICTGLRAIEGDLGHRTIGCTVLVEFSSSAENNASMVWLDGGFDPLLDSQALNEGCLKHSKTHPV